MLVELSCDKFIENDKPRGPIRFTTGLNSVIGANDGANSIGKSTFLLVIVMVSTTSFLVPLIIPHL